MIRPLHPMDMPSYLAFVKRACLGDGVGGGDNRPSKRLLDFLSRSLAIETPKQTWVYAEGRTILGVVSVKSRPGSAAWEIDRFLGADCPNADIVLQTLLDHLSGVGGEEGIQKIFIRLPIDSGLVAVARRAGFFIYARERLYRGSLARPDTDGAYAPFRPRQPQDHLALFELYGRVAPLRTRQAEAMTLQEWRWLDGWQPRRHFRFNLVRGRRDYVWWEGDQAFAWMRFDGRARLLRAILDPARSLTAHADAAISFAATRIPAPGLVYFPVRDYEGIWEAALSSRGFPAIHEDALLVKQLTVRVGEQCLVPVGV